VVWVAVSEASRSSRLAVIRNNVTPRGLGIPDPVGIATVVSERKKHIHLVDD
jgi:hypothetical protein